MSRSPERPLRRREFLGAIAALPVLRLGGPPGSMPGTGQSPYGGLLAGTPLPPRSDARAASLASLAEAILPSAIGADGAARAATAFGRWLDGYAPGAELDHGYGSGSIRYGREADPRPAWHAQLDALDSSARAAHARAFDALDAGRRRDIVRSALEEAGAQRLGSPIAAPHIAAALLAWWYGGPDADDLAQRARIGRETCRPLDAVRERPAALTPGGHP